MATRYQFSEEEIKTIKAARKGNKLKQVDRRLHALELMAEGIKNKEISEKIGYHEVYLKTLVAKYRKGGLEAITGNHYHGNRRNMSVEKEAEILKDFQEKAEAGQVITTAEIKAAYEEAAGHSIGSGQIYYVLKRHGWRKVMPRSQHPQKASEEVIETSKKLTQEFQNSDIM